MKIAISAESTIDLPKELLTKFDISTLPFTLIRGDETKLDGEIQPEELFAFTEKTGKLPKTSAVNEYQFREHFKNLFDLGYEAIIHFSLSSGISSACTNARKVKDEFKNVYVVDTKSLSTGIALLATNARELAEQGLSPEEIYEASLKRVKDSRLPFPWKASTTFIRADAVQGCLGSEPICSISSRKSMSIRIPERGQPERNSSGR